MVYVLNMGIVQNNKVEKYQRTPVLRPVKEFYINLLNLSTRLHITGIGWWLPRTNGELRHWNDPHQQQRDPRLRRQPTQARDRSHEDHHRTLR